LKFAPLIKIANNQNDSYAIAKLYRLRFTTVKGKA